MRDDEQFTSVPRLWCDDTCYILGGGPGLGQVPVDALRERHVIAVNNAYKLANWFDVLFFGDFKWWRWHREALLDWGGLKFTNCEKTAGAHGMPGVLRVRRKRSPFGISTDPHRLCWNLSSGAAAINLAVLLGARRIILYGYDMRVVDGERNWHRDHPDTGNPYARFLRPFPFIAADLERLGIECLNATPGSALRCFPVVPWEDTL